VILLTGFEPFGGEEVNPSSLVAKLAAERLDAMGYAARSATLPVSFKRAGVELIKLLEELKPQVCIALGLNPGSTHVRIERVAVNIKDASKPDNDGEQPVDEPIDPHGPAAYFATLPTRRILERLRREGIPAALSYTAGTFLCNYAMYTLLYFASRNGYPLKAGFIHLPYTPEIAASKPGPPASLSLELQVKAVLLATEETLKQTQPEL